MRKIYRYKNLSFPIGDDENVELMVQFVSDGNIAHTVINIPGPMDKEIANQGTAQLGSGKNLRKDTTVSVSDVANPVPQEDTIKIKYLINNKLGSFVESSCFWVRHNKYLN